LTKLAASNDYILLMAYDFHFRLKRARRRRAHQLDESALVTSLKKIPAKKIILGIPTYGYDGPQAMKESTLPIGSSRDRKGIGRSNYI